MPPNETTIHGLVCESAARRWQASRSERYERASVIDQVTEPMIARASRFRRSGRHKTRLRGERGGWDRRIMRSS